MGSILASIITHEHRHNTVSSQSVCTLLPLPPQVEKVDFLYGGRAIATATHRSCKAAYPLLGGTCLRTIPHFCHLTKALPAQSSKGLIRIDGSRPPASR